MDADFTLSDGHLIGFPIFTLASLTAGRVALYLLRCPDVGPTLALYTDSDLARLAVSVLPRRGVVPFPVQSRDELEQVIERIGRAGVRHVSLDVGCNRGRPGGRIVPIAAVLVALRYD